MKLPLLEKEKVSGKKVFLRADLDVPLSNSKLRIIEDDTRLMSWMPTVKFLLDNKAKVIIAGHLGRPTKNQEFSLLPIAKWLHKKFKVQSSTLRLRSGQELKVKETRIGEFHGWKISDSIFLLENLRFYEGEEKNDVAFAKKLASLADIYVNDAFAVCHRDHASVAGVPKYLPHFAGLRLQKEVEILGSVLENPARPLVVVIGGAKIETKLPLVKQMHRLADCVLVGGKIAREFDEGKHASLIIGELNNNKTDIKDNSIKEFLQIIRRARTVVWNGPLGLVQSSPLKVQSSEIDTEHGTREIAEGIVKSGAYTIVGGGDTIDFLKKIGLLNKFSFVSTGGGAMLAFLSQEFMPGLKALISPSL